MGVFLVCIYIVLIFIRPMDWWEPVLNWQMVNVTAIALLGVALPQVMGQFGKIRALPEARMAAILFPCVIMSWAPTWLGGMIMAFQEFGKVLFLYFFILFLGRELRAYRAFLWTVLLCVGWMAIHGIMQAHTGKGFGDGEPLWRGTGEEGEGVWQIRAFGIFHDPNDLCLEFIVVIPLLWSEYRTNRNVLTKILSLTILPLCIYGAWLTNSRGGIIGIFGMIAAYAVGRTKGIRRWLIASVSILMVTILMPARGAQLGMVDRDRVVAWGDGIAAFKAYPIFGVGYGAFEDRASNAGKAAHNSFVNALAELGLVGYIPWFLVIYVTMFHLRRGVAVISTIDRQDQLQLGALFSALVGYLTSAYFLSRSFQPPLFVLLALATCRLLIACETHNVYDRVFGPFKQEIRRGIYWALGSVVFLWISIRIANKMSGGG